MSHLTPPLPESVRAAREHAKHTQDQAAHVVHSTGRRWREWESGVHRMPPASWELYLLRTQAIIMGEPQELARLHAAGVNAP